MRKYLFVIAALQQNMRAVVIRVQPGHTSAKWLCQNCDMTA